MPLRNCGVGIPNGIPEARARLDRMEYGMATNTGGGFRRGAVKGRSQTRNSRGAWTLRDTSTGKFLNIKSDGKPFKGVRREK